MAVHLPLIYTGWDLDGAGQCGELWEIHTGLPRVGLQLQLNKSAFNKCQLARCWPSRVLSETACAQQYMVFTVPLFYR